MPSLPAALAAVAAVVLFAPATGWAYIDMKVEKITVPRLMLEFKSVGVFQVERVNIEMGAVRFQQTELVQGRPAAEGVKQSIRMGDRVPASLMGLKPGDVAVLFLEDDYGRSITFVRGMWYVCEWDRLSKCWRIGYTDSYYDFGCAFVGSESELADACRRLLAGQKVLVRARKVRQKDDMQFIWCDLRRPHEKPVVAGATSGPASGPAVATGPALVAGSFTGAVTLGAPLDDPAALAGRLADPNANVRIAAADALGRLEAKSAGATAALAAAFANAKEDVLVRRSSAVALGRIGPAARSALPGLLGGAFSDYGEAAGLAGFEAAVAVGRIDPDGSACVPILRQMLQAKDGRKRGRAVSVPGVVGPPLAAAAGMLAEAMKDPSADIRYSAAQSLGRIRPDPAVAVPALVAGLADTAKYVPRASLLALGELGPVAKDAIGPLSVVLANHASAEYRSLAATALGRIGPGAKSAEPALTAALKDTSEEVRYSAKQALKRVRAE